MKPTSKLDEVRKKYDVTKEQLTSMLAAKRMSNEILKDKKFNTRDAINAAFRKCFSGRHVAPLKGMTTQFTTSIRNLLSR